MASDGRHDWTGADDAWLRAAYALGRPVPNIAAVLGVTASAVHNRAKAIGVLHRRKASSREDFRLTAPVVAEDDLQASVADALDKLLLPPAIWFPLPIGHVKLTAPQAARLSRIGVKRGLPDILIIHRGVYGIELKRDGAGLSKTRTVRTKRGSLRVLEGQEDVFPRLLAAGFIDIAVCRDVEGVLTAAKGWRVPMRAFAL